MKDTVGVTMVRSFLVSLALALFACGSTEGFSSLVQFNTVRKSSNTALHVSTLPKKDPSGLSYGERSRPYRRTFYTQPDWEKHRSKRRFVGNLGNLFRSGVVRQLSDEVSLVAFVGFFVCVFNVLLVDGFDDFSNVHHEPLIEGFRFPLLKMPSEFFTFTSPALSLLLGK